MGVGGGGVVGVGVGVGGISPQQTFPPEQNPDSICRPFPILQMFLVVQKLGDEHGMGVGEGVGVGVGGISPQQTVPPPHLYPGIACKPLSATQVVGTMQVLGAPQGGVAGVGVGVIGLQQVVLPPHPRVLSHISQLRLQPEEPLGGIQLPPSSVQTLACAVMYLPRKRKAKKIIIRRINFLA